jgi:hypothetical protein
MIDGHEFDVPASEQGPMAGCCKTEAINNRVPQNGGKSLTD